MRWWDGYQWGPAAQAPDEVAVGRTLAVLAHVGFFLFSIFLALIFYLAEGKKNRFIQHHAREALNFQLTLAMVSIITMFAIVSSIVLTALANGVPSAIFFFVFPVMFAAYVFGIVVSIIGAVKAYRGEWWRYPISIRFIRNRDPL